MPPPPQRNLWNIMHPFINRNLLKVSPKDGIYGDRKTFQPDLIIEDADSITNGTLQLEAAIAGKKYIEIRPLYIYGYYITREAAARDDRSRRPF